MTINFHLIALAGVITTLASVPLFVRVPNPHNSILLDQLHNCGHSLLFFVFHLLTLFVSRYLLVRHFDPPRLSLTIAIASGFSFAVGAAIEIIQPFVGRDASWSDIGRNCLGILAANGAFLTMTPDIRLVLPRIAGAAIAIIALIASLLPAAPWAYAQVLREQALPTLADFENPYLNQYIFAASGGEVHIGEAPPQWRNNKGRVARVAFPQGMRFPGMLLRNPSPAWHDYSALTFDAYSPSETTETIAVNVYSTENGRRPLIHRKLTIKPGLGRYRLDLPEQETLKQHHITDAIWHSLSSDQTAVIYFDNIRLE